MDQSVLEAALKLADAKRVVDDLSITMREYLRSVRKRHVVVALSGGADSAACTALAVRSVGPERVSAVFMPDAASSSESAVAADLVASALGIQLVTHDVSTLLEAHGCYRQIDALALDIFPGFEAARHHLRTEFRIDLEDENSLGRMDIVLVRGDTEMDRVPVGDVTLRRLLACMNLKQRIRAVTAYSFAELSGGIVVNTTNRQELLQGFFVKYGDGAGDIGPLNGLYKSQVRELAVALDVPPAVASRSSTTDTYSASQSQEQFFFAMPERHVDAVLAAVESDLSPVDVASFLGVSQEYASNAMRLVRRRLRLARYVRSVPTELASSPW